MKSNKLKSILILILLPFGANSADLTIRDRITVTGFLSQGYFLSSDNVVVPGSDKDYGSLGFTEAGLNGLIEFSDSLSLGGQMLYRDVSSSGSDTQLDYGSLNWTAGRWGSGEWGVRIGRIKNPFGLYNETRDVAFTRPSTFLPQGIYYDRSRNLLLASDGLQLYLRHETEIGFFQFKSNVGTADGSHPELDMAIFSAAVMGGLQTERESYWFQLEYESPDNRATFAISYADVVFDYKPGTGDILEAGTVRLRPLVLSAQYRWERLTLTSEYLYQKNSFEDLGIFFPDVRMTTESYYLQAEYRFNRQFQGVLRYDAHYLNKNDRDGKKSAVITGNPAHTAFSKDWMIGLRWQPTEEWLIQGEFHRVDGTSWLPIGENPDSLSLKTPWDLFVLMVSYRF